MTITVHFRAKNDDVSSAKQKLLDMGFEIVESVEDTGLLYLTAEQEEVEEILNLKIESGRSSRPTAIAMMGSQKTEVDELAITDSSNLPAEIADLINACYLPLSPTRMPASAPSIKRMNTGAANEDGEK